MFKTTLSALALATGLLASSAMAADTTIRVLFIGDTPAFNTILQKAADSFSAANPGVKVVLEPMENEALRTKLPTLLQSNDPPNVVSSFGGGDIEAQDAAGYLADISADKDALLKLVPASAVNAFQVNGKQVGVADSFSLVNLYANKPLLDKAGVTTDDLKTWDGFVGAVKKLKAAGVTPILTSGGDKWPVQHWLLYLMLREGGGDIMNKVRKDGFNSPEFLKAAQDLIDLGKLQPFKDDWLSVAWLPSIGQFGDGQGALYLAGNWAIVQQADNAKDGKGISRDNLLSVPFPAGPAGGKGDGSETVGGLSGWVITKGSPPEATKFLEYWVSIEQQKVIAEAGLGIPSSIGVEQYIKDPTLQWVVKTIAASSKHQNFADRDLGPAAGGTFNDVAVALAAGEMTPDEAAKALQDSWDNR